MQTKQISWGFHPENILIDNKNEIKLLDWRQGYGDGMYEFGDVYYDLAKFMHGLIVDHKRVHSNDYAISFLENGIRPLTLTVIYLKCSCFSYISIG